MCQLAQNTFHEPPSITPKVGGSAVTEVEVLGQFLLIRPQCTCLHTRTSRNYTPASNRGSLAAGAHLHHDARHPLGTQLRQCVMINYAPALRDHWRAGGASMRVLTGGP